MEASRLGPVLGALMRADIIIDTVQQAKFARMPVAFESAHKDAAAVTQANAQGRLLEVWQEGEAKARELVRKDIAEHSAAIAQGGSAQDPSNYGRAIDLMRIRAQDALLLEEADRKDIDNAYAAALRQYAGTRYAVTLTKFLAWADGLADPKASMLDIGRLYLDIFSEPPSEVAVAYRPSDALPRFAALPGPIKAGEAETTPSHALVPRNALIKKPPRVDPHDPKLMMFIPVVSFADLFVSPAQPTTEERLPTLEPGEIISIDISGSMLWPSGEPDPKLTQAKEAIASFVANNPSRVGISIFGGETRAIPDAASAWTGRFWRWVARLTRRVTALLRVLPDDR